jgi:hypothetical protein
MTLRDIFVDRSHFEEDSCIIFMPTLETLVQQLREVRRRLLQLHKMLLDQERAEYEKTHGPVSSGKLLLLVINHQQFEWLHSFSELIVKIDETLDDSERVTLDSVGILLNQTRRLLLATESQNSFQQTYYAALQLNPAALLAHGELMETLR